MKEYAFLIATFLIGVGVLVLTTFKSELPVEPIETYVESKPKVYPDDVEEKQQLVKKSKIVTQERKTSELNNRLRIVAMEYEKSMKYPPYSQPLSRKQVDLLEPNIFRKLTMKLDTEKGVTASLKLNAFRIFKGEPIAIDIRLESKVDGFNLDKIELLSRRKVVAKVPFKVEKETPESKQFSAQYFPKDKATESWAQELLVRAVFHDKENKQYVVASSFKYVLKEAELLSVDKSYVDNNELVIPLNMEVFSTGRYLVKANLYKEDGEPIAHIYAKKDIEKGKGEISLRAHASALRSKDAPGPYILKDFTIVKVITKIDGKKGYGKSKMQSYKVKGYDLKKYSEEPYHNAAQEQRLAFLQKIGS